MAARRFYPASVTSTQLSENLLDRLLLRRGVQVAVAAALLFCLVPDQIIDDSLIDAAARQGGNKAVAENVPALQHRPFRFVQGPGKGVLCRLRRHRFTAGTKEILLFFS